MKICYRLMIIDGEYYLLVGLLKVIICDVESSLISFCQVVGVAYTPQLRGNSNMYDANQTRNWPSVEIFKILRLISMETINYL